MPAAHASSEALSARPSIRACSMLARAGSPAKAAISANLAWLAMTGILVSCARATLHRGAARRFGRHRSIARRTQGRVGLTAAWRQVMGAGTQAAKFYGWRVVNGAFVLAAFGWGVGVFGPPVFLSAVRDATGWPVAAVAAA